MSEPLTVTHLIIGPDEHGVVRCAVELAAADGGPVVRLATAEATAEAPTGPVHLHFTDRLFGPTAEAGAAAFDRLAARLEALTVTLHDVPVVDGSSWQSRRATTYAAVCAAARGVVVSSHHEAARLATFSPVRPAVIPLPVEPFRGAGDPSSDRDQNVVVLGFVYPGKGHDEALDALPAGAGLMVLGRASDGHQDVVEQLEAQAARLGRRFSVSGFVPDAELPAHLRNAAVPLAPHRQVSASGSIATWLAAGRRPLVPDTPYAREIATAHPGTLTIYADLAPALASAWDHPETTWLTAGTPTGPTRTEVAGAYRAFWRTALAAQRG